MRLEVLERQFDRIQFLFTRVDAKVNAVLAIASGQIAVASVAVSGGDWKNLALLIPAGLFLVSTAFTMINLYRCTFPEVKSGLPAVNDPFPCSSAQEALCHRCPLGDDGSAGNRATLSYARV